jgi:hypothetical protein
MDKFWEWMEANGYGGIYRYKEKQIKYLNYSNRDTTRWLPDFTKQMLIGYMLEYLRNHEVWEQHNRFDIEYFKSNEAKTNLNKIEKITTLFKCSLSLCDLYESVFHIINIVDDEEM